MNTPCGPGAEIGVYFGKINHGAIVDVRRYAKNVALPNILCNLQILACAKSATDSNGLWYCTREIAYH